MIPCTLTPLSYSLSPSTSIQTWSFTGPLYYIIIIQFIINHTHSQLCLIWTHQLVCYCSESSSIIVCLTTPLFIPTSVHPGPYHNSPNWFASPPSHPLMAPLFPHVYYHFPPILPFIWTAWSRRWSHYIPWKHWEPLIQWQCHISLALLQSLNLSAVVCCNMLMF